MRCAISYQERGYGQGGSVRADKGKGLLNFRSARSLPLFSFVGFSFLFARARMYARTHAHVRVCMRVYARRRRQYIIY